MPLILWITLAGVAMAAIALVGSITLALSEAALGRLLLPLVALAAGSAGHEGSSRRGVAGRLERTAQAPACASAEGLWRLTIAGAS